MKQYLFTGFIIAAITMVSHKSAAVTCSWSLVEKNVVLSTTANSCKTKSGTIYYTKYLAPWDENHLFQSPVVIERTIEGNFKFETLARCILFNYGMPIFEITDYVFKRSCN